jgi:hypothetical protein
MSLNVLRNFCRVFQISPKHSKISQYESCLVFRGTQLSCWMAFQILGGKSGKLGQLPAAHVHRNRVAFRVWQQFMQNPLRKHLWAFVKVVEGSEVYNFAIHHLVHFSSKIGRKSWSKWPKMKRLRRNRACATTSPAPACAAPTPRRPRRPGPPAPSQGRASPRRL